jgi:hypothetical protein
MEFKGHMGGVKAVPADQYALIQHHIQHCPSNPLVQKLDAAADALRQIECLTNETECVMAHHVTKIHKLAQNGYRATK